MRIESTPYFRNSGGIFFHLGVQCGDLGIDRVELGIDRVELGIDRVELGAKRFAQCDDHFIHIASLLRALSSGARRE